MRIPLRQLDKHLSGTLAAAYLLAGDEPLLVLEAAERIRAAARERGFLDRELHVVERSFRWDALAGEADNLSLFAARKMVELRLAAPRPGDAGARVLRELVERPSSERLLIMVCGTRLDAKTGRAAWVQAFEKHGVVVDVWPVERAELPRWLAARARSVGLALAPAAAELLADRVEGNLLAADQEIRKLALTAGPARQIDEAAVLEAVADSARFDVFLLRDAVLAADAARAMAILEGLRTEGAQPVLVSWTLSRELNVLARLKFAILHGESVDRALDRERVWRGRQSLVKQALKRYGWRQLTQTLALAAEVDDAVKGAPGAPPWDALTTLVLAMLRPDRTGNVSAA